MDTIAGGRTVLEAYAAWTLVICFAISLAYELWRAFARTGASRFDSPAEFAKLSPLYVVAGVVVGLLLAGVPGAVWIGLVFCVVLIAVSILYYNPRVMLVRGGGQPSLVDWAEDLVYTGLLFAATALLLLEVTGSANV